ncbi:MAG: hypothetical protein H6R09_1249 [Proteobacteria bacterium]|nr:hypothetical protein [Pseudomonadota bacterium]
MSPVTRAPRRGTGNKADAAAQRPIDPTRCDGLTETAA